MNKHPLALAGVLLAALCSTSRPLAAQDGWTTTLSPSSDVVLATGEFELILTLSTKQSCKVPLTLVNGYDFKTSVDGKQGPAVAHRTSGTLALDAGTRIERRIKIPVGNVVPNPKQGGVVRVAFTWAKIPALSAVVSVAPDLRKVDVEKLDLAKTRVTLVTDKGEMVLKFYPEKAPKTVANFVKLAKDGFYNGTTFHRVISGFMIQGGCPNSKPGATGRPGTGNPGYRVNAEFNDIRHVRGVISMAREGHDINSAGSQFFVMHAANTGLDGQYTAFGELVTGEGTLDKIAAGEVRGDAPVDPVTIKAAVVQPVFRKQ